MIESRTKAQELIKQGFIEVNGTIAMKSSQKVTMASSIHVLKTLKYVSRGGDKLEAALKKFNINPSGKICLDVGSSTGGFTDCLLQNNASMVFCIDNGKEQLHSKLREDKRIHLLEEVNIRHLIRDQFCTLLSDLKNNIKTHKIQIEQNIDNIELITVDVSFISLKLVLAPTLNLIRRKNLDVILLIKPQFEAGPKMVNKSGIIKQQSVRETVVTDIKKFCTQQLNLSWISSFESTIKGSEGNIEYFAHVNRSL